MIKNGIIPSIPLFYNKQNFEVIQTKDLFNQTGELDLEAICLYAACGFFLDDDTYFKHIKYVKPASKYQIENNIITFDTKPYFEWYYNPQDISLAKATQDYTDLFHHIIKEKTTNKKIILPLSGGLDSRSLAAALKDHPSLESYSYKFKGGIRETYYSKKIATAEQFKFKEYIIQEGYLWDKIQDIAKINGCMSEFTHARQMAVIDEVSQLGNSFVLGHWGDVLFDGMEVPEKMSSDEMVDSLYKKALKKGGEELAGKLWDYWNLNGDFSQYLKNRLHQILNQIKIDHAGSKIRAFKSQQWAPRWTSTNLQIFAQHNEIILPYYDDRMCEFICTIPEHILDARQIQIEYLKIHAPELARIKWQTYDMNLYHYKKYYHWSNIPNRAVRKIKNKLSSPKILRNWELQFLGKSNIEQLHQHIYHPKFNQFISADIVNEFENKFNTDGVQYSHPLSMILTFSLFNQNSKNP